MTLSDNGLAFIKGFEGFSPCLYNDVAGNCTIGYGHLVHMGPINGDASEQPFQAGVTESQASELLLSDVQKRAEAYLTAGVEVPLMQNQYDALTSFCYNVGGGAFLGSTLLRLVNEGDFNGACEQFGRWVYAGGKIVSGLERRRDAEAKLFSTPPGSQ